MLTALLALAAFHAPGQWNLPGSGPHLIFHYLPWFATEKGEGRLKSWEHWSWQGPGPSHDPNRVLADGRRDIAAKYYPLVGPYSTSDRAVLRYQMETIKAAGGEAVVVDWYTPDMDYDKRMPAIMDEAAKAGLKVGICYEEKANFVWPDFRNPKNRAEALDNVTRDLNYVLSKYASRPNYLRRDGKPFIFEFNGWGQGRLGPNYLTESEWETVQSRLSQPIEYGRQGLDPEFDRSAPGRYLWWSSDAKGIRAFANEARKRIDEGRQDFFMSFISPGFDDSGVSGWGGKARVVDRKGLSQLWGSFQNAFAGNPELVQVVTWNDFNEGTVVEPTREIGFQYLDAIATWWAAKKGSEQGREGARTHGREGNSPPWARISKVDLDAIRRPLREYLRNASATARREMPTDMGSYFAKRSLAVEDPKMLEHMSTPTGF